MHTHGAGKLAATGINKSDDFLTPPELVNAIGPFDLDPCSSHRQTWKLATEEYKFPEQNGLLLPWHGRVFVNPPFTELRKWAERFTLHANGVLLCPARLETLWFKELWKYCNSFYFLRGTLNYIPPEGQHIPRFFGSVLCSIGELPPVPFPGVLISQWSISDGKSPIRISR